MCSHVQVLAVRQLRAYLVQQTRSRVLSLLWEWNFQSQVQLRERDGDWIHFKR